MSNNVIVPAVPNNTDDLLAELSMLPILDNQNIGILKIISSSYTNDDAIENVLNYIENHPISNGCNGIGCSSHASDAITNFQYTQELYDKTNGKQLRHYIIAFKPSYEIDFFSIHNIAYAIGYYFSIRDIKFSMAFTGTTAQKADTTSIMPLTTFPASTVSVTMQAETKKESCWLILISCPIIWLSVQFPAIFRRERI